jgi:GntR family transcriptional regulator, transcriptional repressor for pyruvate dehydrogenase complex
LVDLPVIGNGETLAKQTLKAIRNYILTHSLQPGDRLPSEREFALSLGVSRVTVREAVRALESVGAVSRKPKRGTVLQSPDLGLLGEVSQLLMLRSTSDLAELFVARRVMELGVAPLAAANATEEDIQRMEEANAAMQEEIESGRVSLVADMQFHQALIEAAHNKFLRQFGMLVQEFFREIKLFGPPEEDRVGVALHSEIIEAIKAHDARRVDRLMKRHLDTYIVSEALESGPHHAEPVEAWDGRVRAQSHPSTGSG